MLLWLFTFVCKVNRVSSKEITIFGSRNPLDTDFFDTNCWTVFFVNLLHYRLQLYTDIVVKDLLPCELGMLNSQLAQNILRPGSIRGLITSNSHQLE
jgi:hypothetical protein